MFVHWWTVVLFLWALVSAIEARHQCSCPKNVQEQEKVCQADFAIKGQVLRWRYWRDMYVYNVRIESVYKGRSYIGRGRYMTLKTLRERPFLARVPFRKSCIITGVVEQIRRRKSYFTTSCEWITLFSTLSINQKRSLRRKLYEKNCQCSIGSDKSDPSVCVLPKNKEKAECYRQHSTCVDRQNKKCGKKCAWKSDRRNLRKCLRKLGRPKKKAIKKTKKKIRKIRRKLRKGKLSKKKRKQLKKRRKRLRNKIKKLKKKSSKRNTIFSVKPKSTQSKKASAKKKTKASVSTKPNGKSKRKVIFSVKPKSTQSKKTKAKKKKKTSVSTKPKGKSKRKTIFSVKPKRTQSKKTKASKKKVRRLKKTRRRNRRKNRRRNSRMNRRLNRLRNRIRG